MSLVLSLGLCRWSCGQEHDSKALDPSGYDASDDVFYQIMPISWRHGTPAGEVPEVAAKNRFGNFQGMRDSLPYLHDLGVTSVWMTPIFPSPAYHGYQHGPADRVNPWFGSEAEFWLFVQDAKKAGVKVYLDLVAYGINQDSEYFKGAMEGTGAYAGYIAMAGAGRPFGYSFKTWDGDAVKFANWDLRQKGPRELVTGWCKHWLDPQRGWGQLGRHRGLSARSCLGQVRAGGQGGSGRVRLQHRQLLDGVEAGTTEAQTGRFHVCGAGQVGDVGHGPDAGARCDVHQALRVRGTRGLEPGEGDRAV